MKLGLAAFAASVVFVGCMDIESGISLSRDLSGQISVVYGIDRDAYETGVFDESDNALPIPVSKSEFQMTADRFDGLELRRHNVAMDEDIVVVTAQIEFDSLEALAAWYGVGAIGTVKTAGGTRFIQRIVPGNGSGGEMAKALAESLAKFSVTYRIEAPARIKSVNTGEILGDGRTAVVTRTLASVVTASETEVWEVEW